MKFVKMKCHYEVLNVEMTANDDDIKKSYRKLALKWHPDKNLNNSEAAKEQFQLVQQAYEVLSDPQERSWYDKHRDSILKGGLGSDYKDECINVYEYFTTSCFSGFDDGAKGFYSVYSEVFNKIAAEDSEFDKDLDSDFEIPMFGGSLSSYEEIVHPFYSYWECYSTKKTYSWLDQYDIRQAPNRKIVRLMEKDNKKIRDKAKKERNEEVRALVAYVRKRDRRVIEHVKCMELKAQQNEQKVKEQRLQQILKRKSEISSYVENDWSKFSNLESQLKVIEANLAEEFQDQGSDSYSDEEDGMNKLFCIACNKIFKTAKAFSNHENSKKHRENVDALKAEMEEDEENLMENQSGSGLDEDYCDSDNLSVRSSVEEVSDVIVRPVKKKTHKKGAMQPLDPEFSDVGLGIDIKHNGKVDEFGNFFVTKENSPALDQPESEITENVTMNSLQDNTTVKQNSNKKKSVKKKVLLKNIESLNVDPPMQNININTECCVAGEQSEPFKLKKKKKKLDNKVVKSEELESHSSRINKFQAETTCDFCSFIFKTRNELFKHLKETGHASLKSVESRNQKRKKKK